MINPGRSFLPLFGTGAFWINAGMALHRVSDRAVRAGLRGDLDFVCEGAGWTACIAMSGGQLLIMPSRNTLPPLPRDQMEKMVDVAILANRDLHHGGHWVLAFSDGVLSALWRDQDGDLHFENTFNEPWPRLRSEPREYWAEILERIWQAGTERVRQVGIDPNAIIKRALGERSHP